MEDKTTMITQSTVLSRPALAAQNRKVVVIEAEEMTDDIVRDLHEVIVSMCTRLYGKRSAKDRAKKALDAIHE